MKMNQRVYDILMKIPKAPPETGGIIGIEKGIIRHVVLDPGILNQEAAIYTPNIEFINEMIYKWNSKGIRFAGIFHTHPNGQETLSEGDKDYIFKIMRALRGSLTFLYFPIIIPNHGFYPFFAYEKGDKVLIQSDTYKII